VHDRQDSGIGRRIAVGSRNGRPVGRSQYIAQNTQNRVASTATNVVYVGITSSWCYPMSATADKSTGTATDFVAYCHTMRLKGF
jgi:hypothetical protein